MLDWHRILLPTDFSALARRAAAVACSIANEQDAELHVVHVLAPTPILVPSPETVPPAILAPDPQETARAGKQMDIFVREVLPTLAKPPVTHLLEGFPHQVIARYATDAQIDLIVLGTHGCGLLTRIFVGSTSKSIMENVSCPVLMVPVKDAAVVEAGSRDSS
jgi:nucleotide-binding universal stress UspA family protein